MGSPDAAAPRGVPISRATTGCSPNLRREAYAPAIVRRRLTQIPGERPTNVGDIAIVSRRRSAATTHRCVSPGRFIVIRILYDYRQPSRAEIVRFGSDFEICVGWNGILDDQALRTATLDIGKGYCISEISPGRLRPGRVDTVIERHAGRCAREDHVVTRATHITNCKCLSAERHRCAFSQSREGADHRVASVIINDDESRSGCRRKTDDATQSCATEVYCPRYVNLIIVATRRRAVELDCIG